MSIGAGNTGQNQFRPIGGLAKWVYGAFILLLILCVIAVVSGYLQAELFIRAMNGETITWAEATSNDNREAAIGFGQTALYILAAILFLIWIHRSYKNLTSLNVSGLRFSPGWAVGWFFVPVMSLFRPYQVTSEIYRASTPHVDAAIDDTSWHNIATSPIIATVLNRCC